MPSSVDLAANYAESGVAEVLDQLDRELIGLTPVKTRIREIAALLLVDQARQQLQLASQRVQAPADQSSGAQGGNGIGSMLLSGALSAAQALGPIALKALMPMIP